MTFFHSLCSIIFPSQSFSHTQSFTIFVSQSFFHNLSFQPLFSIYAKFGTHHCSSTVQLFNEIQDESDADLNLIATWLISLELREPLVQGSMRALALSKAILSCLLVAYVGVFRAPLGPLKHLWFLGLSSYGAPRGPKPGLR